MMLGPLPLVLALTAHAAPRLVVVLYPQSSDGRPGNALVDQALRDAFAASGTQVEVHNEYLDLPHVPDDEGQRILAGHLRRKFTRRRVEVVIACLSPGLDFALKYRATAFPGVPIVLLGVERSELRARTLPADVVGIPSHFDLAGSLDVALRLHPRTRNVFVVTGTAPFDLDLEAEARRAFKGHEAAVEFRYLSGLATDRLLERVSQLPTESIIYYLNIFRDGDGKAQVPAEVVQSISTVANAPIYGHVDSFIGRGLVGGRVFRFEDAGRDAATVALRLLAGAPPEDVGIRAPAESLYQFDWRQLRRWGIPESALPPGSDVRFKELTLWDTYKWLVVGVGALCVVQTLLIAGLLMQRASRRRAEARVRQVIELAPSGMLMIGADGRLVLVNSQLERQFGYPRDEMLGHPVEMLLPEGLRGTHASHVARFFADPHIRSMGSGRELFGRRKDGTLFPVEVGLSPVRTDEGIFVLAYVLDITDRRLAAEQLQVVTGRLLEAQETERRRIARELHDDFSQALALLAVELDLLGQSLPPAPVRAQILALADHARDISSSAHAMSHQLHPAKLEQLGLVAALRGLCNELNQAHGLPIDFAPGDLPGPLPAETALCLYRIAQEALRNVTRHAGARRAGVELTADAGEVLLRVSDDGRGFDPDAASSAGLGLVSIRERLRFVGGGITVDSHPGGGTRISVRVPVAGAKATE